MAKGDSGCPAVQGRGCEGLTSPPSCRDSGRVDSGPRGDAAHEPVATTHVVGGGGCATAPDGVAWLGLALLLASLRRVLWGLLLVTLPLVLSPTRAEASALKVLPETPPETLPNGVDALGPHPRDGGEFPALIEADLGEPWGFRFGLATQVISEPVVQVGRTEPITLVPWAIPLQVGASLRMGGAVTAGLAGSVIRSSEIGGKRGDSAAWLSFPLREVGAREGLFLVNRDSDPVFPTITLQLRLELPGTGAAWWLSDPVPEADVDLAFSREAGAWSFLGNFGLRLAPDVSVPGLLWGRRYTWGVGTRRVVVRGTSLVGELYGSTPSSFDIYTPGTSPVELGLGLSNRFGSGLMLTNTLGGGLTHGLGSPSFRWVTLLAYGAKAASDIDADGVSDRRDLCIDVSEDRDGVADQDGCPENDGDNDGIVDERDACPTAPENFNELEDNDGCPDQRALLTFSAHGPFEAAELRIGDTAPLRLLPGEDLVVPVAMGALTLVATAPGCKTVRGHMEVTEDARVKLRLDALQFGDVRLLVRSVEGEPLVAWARVTRPDGEPGSTRMLAVPLTGAHIKLGVGPSNLRVAVPGYATRLVQVEVQHNQRVDVVVELPRDPERQRTLDVLNTVRIHFPVDQDRPVPASDDEIAAVAVLLLAHPEILLLRVEGHADESGSSIYNLDLSRRRAERVANALVAAGVARERVEVLASGEAIPTTDPRRVRFLVLVWDDAYVPEPELPTPVPSKARRSSGLSPNLPMAPTRSGR